MSHAGNKITLREVGLRDGLQIHPTFMPTADKLAWIAAEAAAGMSEIEVTSYVPPKLIPQFADAAEVTEGALKIPDLIVAALIPNLRGAQRGIELGVHKLNFVMSVSETHNMKNVRRPPEDSVTDFRAIVELIKSQPEGKRPHIVGGLSTALGCSYEGRVATSQVVKYAKQLVEAGADELVIADTVGYADPRLVKEVFTAVISEVGPITIGAHFHDTRGTGLANVAAALDCGITHFDASLAGLGGCPFAPGASGNIVMEDLCFMLDSMGLETGIDIEKLIEVRKIISKSLPDIAMQGGLAKAGLPRNYVTVAQRMAGVTHAN
ncbi:hydroxymethylglutaryl-CoA lyase [Orrella sp. NBD-18]|uniref:Hydroxymethylglutaryl-CoA lyase n=1 Tax=Sheuella amnicola TaxID=2707330 RepID=A0A6B2QVB4_9BURK|nr:hydroxymethylglutaryl-CoA lyase [Sheuella amnicola]NDY82596.1 hydroxymethylglutaryl-CoA lyase [Sheuella amnicola]HBI84338.1 hydroxymethylglutaryl-CoA lyase [Alcaligenaceae bacterium]